MEEITVLGIKIIQGQSRTAVNSSNSLFIKKKRGSKFSNGNTHSTQKGDACQSLLLGFGANQISLFIVKVACDPINQREDWGCSREEQYLMVLILMLFFSFFFYPSTSFHVSVPISLPTRFNIREWIFRMRSNMRCVGLNYWCLSTWPLQWLFPQEGFVQISASSSHFCFGLKCSFDVMWEWCWALRGQSNVFIFKSFIFRKNKYQSRHLKDLIAPEGAAKVESE